MSNKLVICGVEPYLSEAFAIARTHWPDREIVLELLPAFNEYAFNLRFLDNYSPDSADIFIALDERAVNVTRLELFATIKGLGFKLEKIIAPSILLISATKIGENCIIHPGVVIGADVRVGYNVIIKSGAVIDSSARIGNSAFISAGAIIGGRAVIGPCSTIGIGVIINCNVQVGEYSELLIPGTYKKSIPDRTFYLEGFSEPAKIIRF